MLTKMELKELLDECRPHINLDEIDSMDMLGVRVYQYFIDGDKYGDPVSKDDAFNVAKCLRYDIRPLETKEERAARDNTQLIKAAFAEASRDYGTYIYDGKTYAILEEAEEVEFEGEEAFSADVMDAAGTRYCMVWSSTDDLLSIAPVDIPH